VGCPEGAKKFFIVTVDVGRAAFLGVRAASTVRCLFRRSRSRSHITTDSQSASQSWYQAPSFFFFILFNLFFYFILRPTVSYEGHYIYYVVSETIEIVVVAPVLLHSNVLLVTMEMKSRSHCIVTDICRFSLMWENCNSSF
jgi:hypothetical protein